METKSEWIDEKMTMVEKITIDVVKTFRLQLLELTDKHKITSIDELRPVVSSTAMSFFMHLIHHLLETMHYELKIDFLMFMRKQATKAIDKLIEETKREKRNMQ